MSQGEQGAVSSAATAGGTALVPDLLRSRRNADIYYRWFGTCRRTCCLPGHTHKCDPIGLCHVMVRSLDDIVTINSSARVHAWYPQSRPQFGIGVV